MVEGNVVVGPQCDEAVDRTPVDADRGAVGHVQGDAMRVDVQFAMLRPHAGPVDHDVGAGIRADAVDTGTQQDLGMLATGEDKFHGLPFMGGWISRSWAARLDSGRPRLEVQT